MKNILIFCVLNLLLISCTTLYKSGYSATPSVSIAVTPVVADLVIDTSKVLQGTSTTTIYFKVFKFSDSEFSEAFGATPEIKAATYKALAGTGNDIIVNPKYIVQTEKRLLVLKTTATVSGYGAKIRISKTKNTFK